MIASSAGRYIVVSPDECTLGFVKLAKIREVIPPVNADGFTSLDHTEIPPLM